MALLDFLDSGGGDGFLSRLNTGIQSIGNGGSILGAMTGNYTDPQTSIGVGDYQMPRMGDASVYNPQQGLQPPSFGGDGSFISHLNNPDGLIARLNGSGGNPNGLMSRLGAWRR